MTLQELAAKSLEPILKNGLDNKFLDFVKQKLNSGSKFYENIPDDETISRFAQDVISGNVELSDVTMEQSEKADYWNRGDLASFLYTSRILPKVKEEYPEVYKEITEGDQIWPAGLDEQSRRDKKASTIWNAVEQTEAAQRQDAEEDTEDASAEGDEESGEEGVSQGERFKNSFLKASRDRQQQAVQQRIAKNGGPVLKGDQLVATTNFVRNLLRSM